MKYSTHTYFNRDFPKVTFLEFTNRSPTVLKQSSWNYLGKVYRSKIFDKRPWRGQRGPRSIFTFLLYISDRGEWQLSGTFFEMEKYCSLPRYRIFKSQKYIQLHCACEVKPQKWKYRILKISNFSFLMIFLQGGHFQFFIFSLLRPKSKIGSHKMFVLVPKT